MEQKLPIVSLPNACGAKLISSKNLRSNSASGEYTLGYTHNESAFLKDQLLM